MELKCGHTDLWSSNFKPVHRIKPRNHLTCINKTVHNNNNKASRQLGARADAIKALCQFS